MDAYSGTYDIRWADLDANGHIHYSAYIDAAADLRCRFLPNAVSRRTFFSNWGSGRFIVRSKPASGGRS